MSDVSAAPGWQRRRRLLFDEYERVALTLFAERGFRNATVDEVAAAAGVSERTLFRYFPTKDDFLLAFPRRMLESTCDIIASLPVTTSPLSAVWSVLRDQFDEGEVDLAALTLWRSAALEAPDVVARTRGERQEALVDAISAYCARCLGADAARDPLPRLYAGVIAGADMALIELWGRSGLTREEITRAADQLVELLGKRP